jgi:rod shape-determining protein MreD
MQRFASVESVTAPRHSLGALLGVSAALLGAWLVQTVVVVHFPPLAPRPDLVLLIALAWGYLRGSWEGMGLAIAGGLLLDGSSSAPFGVHVLGLTVTTGLVTSEQGPFARGTVRRALGAALAATALHLLALTSLQLSGWEVWWPAATVRVVMPTVLLDAALLPLCYRLLQSLPQPKSQTLANGV